MKQKIHWLPLFFIFLAVIVITMGLFSNFLCTHDPLKIDMGHSLLGMNQEHILGTDALGRDTYSRLISAVRVSLLLAILATFLSLSLGTLLGMLAGYYGGWLDYIITSLTSILHGLPSTSVMLAISAMMGGGYLSLIISIVLTSWSGFSRLVRGEVMKIKEEDYVIGALTIGASNFRIMAKYIFPTVFQDLLIVFAQRIASSMLSIAGLSYLGLGIQPPTPDLGGMINEAKGYFRTVPILIIAPGLTLLVISLGINYTAEIIRDNLANRKYKAE